MKKTLFSLFILYFFFAFSKHHQVNISNIFPDRGPLDGNTRVLIYSKQFHKLNSRSYQRAKVKYLKRIKLKKYIISSFSIKI